MGHPVFNLVKENFTGIEIESIRGLLNSTSNFILTEMSRA